MLKRLTLDEVKRRIEIISPNIEILNGIYINNSTKLKCKCRIDAYEWDANYSNLSKGKGCPKCAGRPKINITQVKENMFEINPNIEIVDTIYKGVDYKLLCKCLKDEYKWSSTYDHLRSGHGCPSCANTITLSLEEVKQKLKEINPNIELLSKRYVNAREKLLFKCKIDNYEWETTWDSVFRGHGCSKCANLENKGENNFNWKGGISSLAEHLRTKISVWKQDSLKKYNYKCDITGINSTIIHHLYGFSDILQETIAQLVLPIHSEMNCYTELEIHRINKECLKLHYKYGLGVCLSEDIHKEFHLIYKYGNNTPEQYYEFKKQKMKQQLDDILTG